MEWMRAAMKRTALQEKSRVNAAKPDTSNEQLSTLRAELAKVKATLAATKHVPHAGGDDGHNTVSDKRTREEDEATTGTETELERHLQKHARTSASEASVTEYDTCAEDLKRPSVGTDGASVHRRRRSIAERRRHTRSASPAAPT